MFGRYRTPIRFDSVRDGLFNTIMIGETLPGQCSFYALFAVNNILSPTSLPINTMKSDEATVGCRREGPELVPVRGEITFGGGSWPKPGLLYFTAKSTSPGMPNRPALGAFDTDGKLTVTSAKKGDGLVPGKYKIAVECWEVPPQMGATLAPKSYVPARYASPATSGLTVAVEPGQKVVELHLDVAKN
jgi:hypothetical protein